MPFNNLYEAWKFRLILTFSTPAENFNRKKWRKLTLRVRIQWIAHAKIKIKIFWAYNSDRNQGKRIYLKYITRYIPKRIPSTCFDTSTSFLVRTNTKIPEAWGELKCPKVLNQSRHGKFWFHPITAHHTNSWPTTGSQALSRSSKSKQTCVENRRRDTIIGL